jgi:hypothetical protein
VYDRGPIGALALCAFDVNVNPLPVAAALGELIDAGLIYGQPTRHAKFFADIYWAKFARAICGMLYCLPDQFIQLSWVLTPHLRGRQNATASLHQRTAAEAQVSPPPKAVRMSTSPRANRPCSNASCSAIGS